MILAPSPVQQFTDNSGALLVGGQLFIYEAATTTKQAPFTDATGVTTLPNPIILNVRGEVAASSSGTSCGIWLDPTLAYKFVLAPATDTDPPTNPFWTIDNVVSPQSAILAALSQYQASLGGVPVGAMMAYGGATAPGGWVLCYGQAVSRTAYSLLFATIGIAYGAGDGSSTFNLPDKRGRVSIGADNMGGSAANRVTQAVSGILATTVGQAGGSQLAQPDTLTATTTVNIVDPGHLHNFPNNGQVVAQGQTGIAEFNQPFFGLVGTNTNTAATGISATASTTIANTLTGTAQNMIPAQVDNWIIYAGTPSS